MKPEDCKPGVRVLHVPSNKIGTVIGDCLTTEYGTVAVVVFPDSEWSWGLPFCDLEPVTPAPADNKEMQPC